MSEIVIIADGQAVTTTLAIAEGTKNSHEAVIKLVRKYAADLREFGVLDFESESSGGRPTEYAVLNEQQATLLLTYMRNSEIVRAFKKKLVKEFWSMAQRLRDMALDRTRSRHIAASAYKLMSTVLKDSREALGKMVAPHHFMIEAKLVNFALAGQYKGLNRDSLTLPQLDLLGELEVKNAALILQGKKYEERKKALLVFVQAWKVTHPEFELLEVA